MDNPDDAGLEFLLPTEADCARSLGLGAFLERRGHQVDYGSPWLVEVLQVLANPTSLRAAGMSSEQSACAAQRLSESAELRDAVAAASRLARDDPDARFQAVAALLRDAGLF